MKKAQFYLFTAIVLSAVAFGVILVDSVLPLPTKEFAVLCENIHNEVIFGVNQAYLEQINVSTRLLSLGSSVSDYVHSVDPNFGFVYLLKENNSVSVLNYLDDLIEIDNSTLNSVSYQQLRVINNASKLKFNGTSYDLSWESYENQVRTFCIISNDKLLQVKLLS